MDAAKKSCSQATAVYREVSVVIISDIGVTLLWAIIEKRRFVLLRDPESEAH